MEYELALARLNLDHGSDQFAGLNKHDEFNIYYSVQIIDVANKSVEEKPQYSGVAPENGEWSVKVGQPFIGPATILTFKINHSEAALIGLAFVENDNEEAARAAGAVALAIASYGWMSPDPFTKIIGSALAAAGIVSREVLGSEPEKLGAAFLEVQATNPDGSNVSEQWESDGYALKKIRLIDGGEADPKFKGQNLRDLWFDKHNIRANFNTYIRKVE